MVIVLKTCVRGLLECRQLDRCRCVKALLLLCMVVRLLSMPSHVLQVDDSYLGLDRPGAQWELQLRGVWPTGGVLPGHYGCAHPRPQLPGSVPPACRTAVSQQ